MKTPKPLLTSTMITVLRKIDLTVPKYINLEVLLLATLGFERPNFLTEFQDLSCKHKN